MVELSVTLLMLLLMAVAILLFPVVLTMRFCPLRASILVVAPLKLRLAPKKAVSPFKVTVPP